jgi:dihydrofolate reductase
MRKLIESTHVALGGEIDPVDWAFPYLDDEHERYASALLNEADALLLGRKTYEGLSPRYLAWRRVRVGTCSRRSTARRNCGWRTSRASRVVS